MVVLLLSFLLAWRLIPYLLVLMVNSEMVKRNWQGKAIPAVAGIIFPLILSITLFPYLWSEERSVFLVYLLAVFGAALVGLFDDVLGGSKPRGLLNHFRYFFLENKVSTGLVKAIVIGIISIWVVSMIGGRWFEYLGNALLLVLTVNFINLLDLRPGRALKGVLFLFLLPLLFQVPGQGLLFSSLGIMLAYAPYDLQGKVMLGDTGANVLGMISGFLLLATPLWVKMILLVFMFSLHVVTEKYSLTVIIEKNPFLKKIDEWGQDSNLKTGVKR